MFLIVQFRKQTGNLRKEAKLYCMLLTINHDVKFNILQKSRNLDARCLQELRLVTGAFLFSVLRVRPTFCLPTRLFFVCL